MVQAKKFKKAAFGVQSKRFSDIRVHPRWRHFPVEGTSQDEYLIPTLGPGHYDCKDYLSEKKPTGSGWKEAVKTEEFSHLPQVSLKDTKWKTIREKGWNLGPGTYHIKDFLEERDLKFSSKHGISDTLEKPRFKDPKFATPGPGHYGDGGIPSAAKDTFYKKPLTQIGIIDYSSGISRAPPSVGCRLGPGEYERKGGIEDITKKVVSRKGPYTLFTGKRDETTLYGLQTKPWRADIGPGQYEFTSMAELLDSSNKKRHGKFLKSSRFPESSAKITPGPSDYNPSFPKKPKPARWPAFFSDVERKSIFECKSKVPGVGRYNLDKGYKISHCGNVSAFKAEGKYLTKDREKFLNYRTSAKNVPLTQRSLYKAEYMIK